MTWSEPPEWPGDAALPPPPRLVVVVTGGSSGVGAAACLTLARHGARVVVVGRDPGRVAAVVASARAQQSAGGAPEALGMVLDVTREQDMQEMTDRTVEAFGRLDALVAAAATLRGAAGRPRRATELTVAEWQEVMGTNLTGVFLSNRAVLPVMISQGRGDIVNISSTSGLRGLAFDSAYCASKFGVIGLSQAVADECGPLGVRVHVVLPGPTDTPMWHHGDAIPHLEPALPAQRLAELIRRLVALPDEVRVSDLVVTPAQQLHGRLVGARKGG